MMTHDVLTKNYDIESFMAKHLLSEPARYFDFRQVHKNSGKIPGPCNKGVVQRVAMGQCRTLQEDRINRCVECVDITQLYEWLSSPPLRSKPMPDYIERLLHVEPEMWDIYHQRAHLEKANRPWQLRLSDIPSDQTTREEYMQIETNAPGTFVAICNNDLQLTNMKTVSNMNFTHVTIPSIPEGGHLMRAIEPSAFQLNSTLTSIVISENIEEIGDAAFDGCTGLISVTIPDSVTTIGDEAFDGCTSLISVHIPNGVINIQAWSFCDCMGLTSVPIPESVANIEWKAFSGCTSLTSIITPPNVTYIGGESFAKCTNLTSVTISNGVIGHHAFDGCTSLASVTILEGTTEINEGAFNNCSELTSVTIPESVITIGQGAFHGTRILNFTPTAWQLMRPGRSEPLVDRDFGFDVL